jgi:hypothetical protein
MAIPSQVLRFSDPSAYGLPLLEDERQTRLELLDLDGR